jgi:hypothetical protein
MTQSNSDPAQNTFNISGSSITNLTGSGSISYNEAASQPAAQTPPLGYQSHSSSDRTAPDQKRIILLLAANPKSTQKLRLDEEVREIEQGLQRAR